MDTIFAIVIIIGVGIYLCMRFKKSLAKKETLGACGGCVGCDTQPQLMNNCCPTPKEAPVDEPNTLKVEVIHECCCSTHIHNEKPIDKK